MILFIFYEYFIHIFGARDAGPGPEAAMCINIPGLRRLSPNKNQTKIAPCIQEGLIWDCALQGPSPNNFNGIFSSSLEYGPQEIAIKIVC